MSLDAEPTLDLTDLRGGVGTLGEPATLFARDVGAWFGDHYVLEGVTLEMPARTVTALIGPSGCGNRRSSGS